MIIEQGSHYELMEKGGRYADLYRMQAAAFVDKGTMESMTPP